MIRASMKILRLIIKLFVIIIFLFQSQPVFSLAAKTGFEKRRVPRLASLRKNLSRGRSLRLIQYEETYRGELKTSQTILAQINSTLKEKSSFLASDLEKELKKIKVSESFASMPISINIYNKDKSEQIIHFNHEKDINYYYINLEKFPYLEKLKELEDRELLKKEGFLDLTEQTGLTVYFSMLDFDFLSEILKNETSYYVPLSDHQIKKLLPESINFQSSSGGILLKPWLKLDTENGKKLVGSLKKLLPKSIFEQFQKAYRDVPVEEIASICFSHMAKMTVSGEMATMLPSYFAKLMSSDGKIEEHGIKIGEYEYRFVVMQKKREAMRFDKYKKQLEKSSRFEEGFNERHYVIFKKLEKIKITDKKFETNINNLIENLRKLIIFLEEIINNYEEQDEYSDKKRELIRLKKESEQIKRKIVTNIKQGQKLENLAKLNKLLNKIHGISIDFFSKIDESFGSDASYAELIASTIIKGKKPDTYKIRIKDVSNEISDKKEYCINIKFLILMFLNIAEYPSKMTLRIVKEKIAIEMQLGAHHAKIDLKLTDPSLGGNIYLGYNEGSLRKGNKRRAALVEKILQTFGFEKVPKQFRKGYTLEYQYNKDTGAISVDDIIKRFSMLQKLSAVLLEFDHLCEGVSDVFYDLFLEKYSELFPILGTISPRDVLGYYLTKKGEFVSKDKKEINIKKSLQFLCSFLNRFIKEHSFPINTLFKEVTFWRLDKFLRKLEIQRDKGSLKPGPSASPVCRDFKRETLEPIDFMQKMLEQRYLAIEEYDVSSIVNFILKKRIDLVDFSEQEGTIGGLPIYKIEIPVFYYTKCTIYYYYEESNNNVLLAFAVKGDSLQIKKTIPMFNDALMSRDELDSCIVENYIASFKEEKFEALTEEAFGELKRTCREGSLSKKYDIPNVNNLLKLPFVRGMSISSGSRVLGRVLYQGDRTPFALNGSILFTRSVDTKDSGLFKTVPAVVLTNGGPLTHSSMLMKEVGCVGVVVKQGTWVLHKGGSCLAVHLQAYNRIRQEETGGYLVEYYKNGCLIETTIEEETLVFIDGVSGRVYVFDRSKDLLEVYSSLRNIENNVNVGGEYEKLEEILENTKEKDVAKYVLSYMFLSSLLSDSLKNHQREGLIKAMRNNSVFINITDTFLKDLDEFYSENIDKFSKKIKESKNFYEVQFFYNQVQEYLSKYQRLKEVESEQKREQKRTEIRSTCLKRVKKFCQKVKESINKTSIESSKFQSQLELLKNMIEFLEGLDIDPKIEKLKNFYEEKCLILERQKTENKELLERNIILQKEASSLLVDQIGRKAVCLAAIDRNKIKCPDWFVVTTKAVESIIDKNKEIIDEKVEQRSANDEEFIKNLAKSLIIPEDLEQEIINKYREFGKGAMVAVRSSATKEDGADNSFAGQYETYLNQTGDWHVLRSIKRVIASLWTQKICEYRKSIGDEKIGKMAVLIQRMVPDIVLSGVASSINLIEQNFKQAVIQVGAGLGIGIVDDQVPTDVIIVNKDSGRIVSSEITWKNKKVIEITGGGIELVEVVDSEAGNNLDKKQIESLLEKIKIIESYNNGMPVDVEWAISKSGEVFILQQRPLVGVTSTSESFEKETIGNFKLLIKLKTSDEQAKEAIKTMESNLDKDYSEVIEAFVCASFARYRHNEDTKLIERFKMLVETKKKKWIEIIADNFIKAVVENWQSLSLEDIKFLFESYESMQSCLLDRIIKEKKDEFIYNEKDFVGILKMLLSIFKEDESTEKKGSKKRKSALNVLESALKKEKGSSVSDQSLLYFDTGSEHLSELGSKLSSVAGSDHFSEAGSEYSSRAGSELGAPCMTASSLSTVVEVENIVEKPITLFLERFLSVSEEHLKILGTDFSEVFKEFETILRKSRFIGRILDSIYSNMEREIVLPGLFQSTGAYDDSISQSAFDVTVKIMEGKVGVRCGSQDNIIKNNKLIECPDALCSLREMLSEVRRTLLKESMFFPDKNLGRVFRRLIDNWWDDSYGDFFEFEKQDLDDGTKRLSIELLNVVTEITRTTQRQWSVKEGKFVTLFSLKDKVEDVLSGYVDFKIEKNEEDIETLIIRDLKIDYSKKGLEQYKYTGLERELVKELIKQNSNISKIIIFEELIDVACLEEERVFKYTDEEDERKLVLNTEVIPVSHDIEIQVLKAVEYAA
jgi:phosphoenolpyruvate synthase/pyruvate phosphate dikinase